MHREVDIRRGSSRCRYLRRQYRIREQERNHPIPVLKENIEDVIGCDVDEEVEVIDGMIRKSQMDLLAAGKDNNAVQEIGERIISLRERKQNALTQAATRKDEIARI